MTATKWKLAKCLLISLYNILHEYFGLWPAIKRTPRFLLPYFYHLMGNTLLIVEQNIKLNLISYDFISILIILRLLKILYHHNGPGNIYLLTYAL